MRKLGILLAMILTLGLATSNARAGYVDITYDFSGSTVAITMPITFNITGVTGSATLRFSQSNASSHPLASADVTQLSFMLNVPVNALGGGLTGTVMQQATQTIGTAHFNGTAVVPSSGAYQVHQLTGFLHCFATFHYMNSYNYMTPMGIAVCTMTVGLPYSQISVQYGITGSTNVPLPTFFIGGTGSSLGSSFLANTAIKQQLAQLPPSLGTAYLIGTATGKVHEVPEAGSSLLLGAGLAGLIGISLAGRRIRRR